MEEKHSVYTVCGGHPKQHVVENIQEETFGTAAEADAYRRGFDDAEGWMEGFYFPTKAEAIEFCVQAQARRN